MQRKIKLPDPGMPDLNGALANGQPLSVTDQPASVDNQAPSVDRQPHCSLFLVCEEGKGLIPKGQRCK